MALGVFSNDVKQWLPRGFEESVKYDWFIESFGIDEMAVVSWDGCQASDPRLERLARDLESARAADGELLFSQVITGPQILGRLTALGWTEAEAMEKVSGLFIGADGTTTCLLLVPAPAQVRNRTRVIQLLKEQVTASIGLPLSALRLGGPVVDGAAIDQESKLALRQFLWMTIAVVFGLTWLRKRSFRLAVVIMAFSGYCAGLSLAILYFCGGSMNLTMIMLPTLTLILGVATSIHMVNYFLKSLASGGPRDPVHGYSAGVRAIRAGGYPVFLSSATTAVGMASLATSQIAPIRNFGLYSAAAVMLSLPVIVNALMWVMDRSTGWLQDRHLEHLLDDGREPTAGPMINWLSRQTWRYASLIVLVTVLGSGVIAWFAKDLQASVKIQNRFARSTRIIEDYQWLEKSLGPLVPMEVVVRFPADHAADPWGRMKAVEYLETRLRKDPSVNASWSAATFRPPLRGGSGLVRETSERVLKTEWAENLGKMLDAGLVANVDGEQLWRISLRIAAMNDIDYGDLLDQVDQSLDREVASLNAVFAKRGQQPIRTEVTGAVPMMYKAQHQIFRDLALSFLTAFGLIAVTLMIVLRSVVGGLLAMLPNILPPMIVFGWMGLTGTRIEIGSVMTASIALGISVDDTIHFLSWFRKSHVRSGSRPEAVQKAYAYCSRSMIDTTLICGLGVAPFMMSSFMPTVQFAKLMLALLFFALLGDLIQLPAMLNSPLGWFFESRRKKGPAGGDKGSSLSAGEESADVGTSPSGASDGAPGNSRSPVLQPKLGNNRSQRLRQ